MKVYVKNFNMNLQKALDIASVFHSKERMDSFLESMIEQSYELHGGVYPLVYESKHHVFNADYFWIIDCMVIWLHREGGADLMETREYFKKYFVSTKEGFHFPSRFLVFVVFGITHDILGGFIPDMLANKKYKFYKGKGKDNSYLGGLPFYQRVWYYHLEKDINFEFRNISLVKFRLFECTDDAGEKMMKTSKKAGLKQVAFGKKMAEKLEEDGEKYTLFYKIQLVKE